MSPPETFALLVLGLGGPLAGDLVDVARPLGQTAFCRGLSDAELDLADPFAVKDVVGQWCRVVRSDSPEHRVVVVNAAEAGPAAAAADEEAAYAVNATGPALLAQACAAHGAQLVHVSTGAVFAGDRGEGAYDVDDEPAPTTAYGRTRLAGELAVRALLPDSSWVVRTSWLYGVRGDSLVRRVAGLHPEGEGLPAAEDAHGTPTWSRDLARGLWALVREDPPAGTLHCTDGGATTELGFAQAVLEELGADPALARPARRDPEDPAGPVPAVLSTASWAQVGLPRLPEWRAALHDALRLHGKDWAR